MLCSGRKNIETKLIVFDPCIHIIASAQASATARRSNRLAEIQTVTGQGPGSHVGLVAECHPFTELGNGGKQ